MLLRLVGLFLASFVLLACSDDPEPSGSKDTNEEDRIKEMIAAEELVQELGPKLRALGASLVSGSREGLPDEVAGDASIPPWEGLDSGRRWTSASFGTLGTAFKDGGFEHKTKFEGVRRGEGTEVAIRGCRQFPAGLLAHDRTGLRGPVCGGGRRPEKSGKRHPGKNAKRLRNPRGKKNAKRPPLKR